MVSVDEEGLITGFYLEIIESASTKVIEDNKVS